MTREQIEALLNATEANERALRDVDAPSDIREEAMDIIAAAAPLCAALRAEMARADAESKEAASWKLRAHELARDVVRLLNRALAAEALLGPVQEAARAYLKRRAPATEAEIVSAALSTLAKPEGDAGGAST
jgi:hypothetical protein